MESEVLIAMQVQHRYLSKVLLKENFDKAVDNKLAGKERSPAELFEHCISTLYRHSYAGVNEIEPEEVEFNLDEKLERREQILDAYEKAIRMFEELRQKYDKNMDDIIHEASGTIRRQAYSTIAMHTMHHIAQALLLTNVYIRNH